MDIYNLHPLNEEFEPRNLYDDEIEYLLKDIPNPRGLGKTAPKLARETIVTKVRFYLEKIKIIPVPEALEDLKSDIMNSFLNSLISAGTPVGVLAGTALGAPITQMTLNTHRSAGAQSGVAVTFTKIRDFLTGSKLMRNSEMNIFLKRDPELDQIEQLNDTIWPGFLPSAGLNLYDTYHTGTEDEIFEMRKDWEQTLVEDVVIPNGSHILDKEEALSLGVDKLLSMFSILYPNKFPNPDINFPLNYVLMLELNTYRMYSHGITMSSLAEKIEGPSPKESIGCVWFSEFDNRFFILANEI